MKFIVSFGFLLALWQGLSLAFGEVLVPGPLPVAVEMAGLLGEAESWRHILVTVFSGTTGVVLSFAAAFLLGIPAGLSRKTMEVISPIVSASQGCPPVIWISLLMVWAGMTSTLPVIVVIITLFPSMFFNIAQGVASLDSHLFSMARLYHAGRFRMLKDIVLPGIRPYLLSSLSFSMGMAWKVTATAEFFGSYAGIGSRLYWSYRYLDIPRLFCWAVLLMMAGFLIEYFIIEPMRSGDRKPVMKVDND